MKGLGEYIMEDQLKDRVTIYEVATAAGVSLATVSRVINNHQNVTPKTRKKVEDAIERLNYRPSGLAQALATSKTTNIGVVIPSADYVYIANMLNGITETARENGYAITLFVTSHDEEEALQAIDKLITSHVDGAIIFDDELEEEDVRKIVGYQVPVVVVNNRIENADNIGCITFGYEHTLREIIKKHAESYDKKMYFVRTDDHPGRLLERLQRSFVNTHKALNKEYEIIDSSDSYTETYNQFLEIFKTTKSGFFLCYRDSLAAAVMNAAKESDLRIPEDVEILSLIGTKYANIFRPKISNMHLDMKKIGSDAMVMLKSMLNGEKNPKRTKEVTKLVQLGTTNKIDIIEN
jgi:LacI family transcriptional regulator